MAVTDQHYQAVGCTCGSVIDGRNVRGRLIRIRLALHTWRPQSRQATRLDKDNLLVRLRFGHEASCILSVFRSRNRQMKRCSRNHETPDVPSIVKAWFSQRENHRSYRSKTRNWWCPVLRRISCIDRSPPLLAPIHWFNLHTRSWRRRNRVCIGGVFSTR